jgi:4-carboxymuconolactone decarboxylase
MRLTPIAPEQLTAEQRPFYDDMQAVIVKNFQGFKSFDDTGALIGPFNPWLQEPQFGKPIWELAKAMSTAPSLPATVREVAILVVGAKFHAPYEMYAHVALAELRGLQDEKLATIVAGQRPSNLTAQETIAYDVASALLAGGVLPELNYRAAVKAFGAHGTAELIYLVSFYCLVCLTLNGYDAPVPEETA